MDTRMKATIASVSSTFLIIIVSLTGAIRIKDTCNFDVGLCGWIQGHADNFNWIRTSRNGSSINTGPWSGHTTGNSTDDYYMYINALKQKEGDRAVLQRMEFDHMGRACISFWYHMYGSHMGTLNINVRKNGDSPNLVWSKTGSQYANWIHAAVDLEIGSNATIEFEAIRGSGSFGNMALDDVSLTYESCFNCAFDEDFCLWKETEFWKLSSNQAQSGIYATMVDPHYCASYFDPFLSTPVHAMQGPVCISFLYFLNGSDNRLYLYSISKNIHSVIWIGGSNSTWSMVSTFVNEGLPNFTLQFEMYPGHSCLGVAGLKNIYVMMGKCSTVISKTTSPHPNVSEFQTTSSTDFINEIDHTQISVAAIIGLVVGSLVLVVVLAIVAICIFRKMQCSKERNSGNTILQLPSYETLQHRENTEDYIHVVHSSNPSSTQYSNVPLPHNITSNNDNEYDYVS